MKLKRADIFQGNIGYSYVMITSIVPSKFQNQAIHLMWVIDKAT